MQFEYSTEIISAVANGRVLYGADLGNILLKSHTIGQETKQGYLSTLHVDGSALW